MDSSRGFLTAFRELSNSSPVISSYIIDYIHLEVLCSKYSICFLKALFNHVSSQARLYITPPSAPSLFETSTLHSLISSFPYELLVPIITKEFQLNLVIKSPVQITVLHVISYIFLRQIAFLLLWPVDVRSTAG